MFIHSYIVFGWTFATDAAKKSSTEPQVHGKDKDCTINYSYIVQ